MSVKQSCCKSAKPGRKQQHRPRRAVSSTNALHEETLSAGQNKLRLTPICTKTTDTPKQILAVRSHGALYQHCVEMSAMVSAEKTFMLRHYSNSIYLHYSMQKERD